MSKPVKITDINSLLLEKNRLRMLEEQKKQTLELHYKYIRDNFRSLIWKAINPLENSNSGIVQLIQFGRKNLLPALLGNNQAEMEGKSDAALLGMLLLKWIGKIKNKKGKNDADIPQ